MLTRWVSYVAIIIFGLTAVACSSGGGMKVTNVWGRVSPATAANGAFYMRIENKTGEDDVLRSVQADVCGVAELHESFMKEGGVMGMRPMPHGEIPIPAGEVVTLKVGGTHVMCMNKKVAFEAGERYPLVLEFSRFGTLQVEAEIRENE